MAILTIKGTKNADILLGGLLAEQIEGLAGNDQLKGGGGDDVLLGGDGDDKLYGGFDNDWLDGGAGKDQLYGEDGDDRLYGFAGDDQIDGGIGNDLIYGGADKDQLRGGDGLDQLFGEAGDDQIDGGAGDDKLDGGLGKDQLIAGAGNDVLAGGDDIDQLDGGPGDDNLDGGAGNDVLIAGEGVDILKGGLGDDKLDAGAGNDTLDGGDGKDNIVGGLGRDVISGGFGNDTIDGGAGVDIVDFAGLAAHYQITNNLGVTTVKDLLAAVDGNDGTDSLQGVERARFKDGTIVFLTPNNAPTAGYDFWPTLANVPFSGNVMANDADADLDPIAITAVMGLAANVGQWVVLSGGAKIKIDANGAFSYDAAGSHDNLASYQFVADFFNYTLSDGFGGVTVGFGSMGVQGVNDAPRLVIDATEFDLAAGSSTTLSFANSFVDPDPDNYLVYTATLADGSPLPAFLAFNPWAPAISATPTIADFGTYEVALTAIDLSGAKTTDFFVIDVTL